MSEVSAWWVSWDPIADVKGNAHASLPTKFQICLLQPLVK
jgi:hypothetical protein